MLKERIAIIDGIRSPIGKAGGTLKGVSADDLGAYVLREFVAKLPISPDDIDEVIIGNVAQPSNAANVGRVIALKAGLNRKIPAITVHRNCASGMEAITIGASKILSGESTVVIAGGTESMSNIPLLYGHKMTAFFDRLSRAKTMSQKLSVLLTFRLHFLKPRIGLLEGLTDPTCGLIMGMTAENLANDFKISRDAQDQFALESHRKAAKAMAAGIFKEEILPFPVAPKYDVVMSDDESIRKDQTLEALQKLKPYFDRDHGTVTVGNACPISDGAGMVLLMSESEAKKRGLTPLGFLSDYAYVGLDPTRMGLGPVHAISKLFEKTGLGFDSIDLVEINEAFSVQVMACLMALGSDDFAKRELGRNTAVGQLNPEIVNVNGGAVALGHPVGMTGTRLVITLLKELKRRGKHRGIASLCVGGGQGAALLLETQ